MWSDNALSGQFDHQVVLTAQELRGFHVHSTRATQAIGDSGELEAEVNPESFTFDSVGSASAYDDADLDMDANLENVGLPGFRAPLKVRTNAGDNYSVQSSPHSSAWPISDGDVGISDYAPPEEW